jgi:RHS repeat-associated protein
VLRDADHLGTTRVVTNASGAVVSRTDFKPFGEQIAVVGGTPRVNVAGYSADSGVSLKFTGQVRDASMQDYFGARYFSGYQGRFTSPDVPLLDQNPLDPQSWNLYSYGRNNPLANTDPTGNCSVKHEGQPASDDPGEPCVEKSDTTVEVTARAPQRDYSWSDLTFNWVRGNTRRIESFTENDKYTQQLRDRRLIRSKVAAAKTLAARCNPQFPAGDVSERLGNYPKGQESSSRMVLISHSTQGIPTQRLVLSAALGCRTELPGSARARAPLQSRSQSSTPRRSLLQRAIPHRVIGVPVIADRLG